MKIYLAGGMAPAECPRGRELYAEVVKFENTFQFYGRFHMLLLVMDATEKLQEHVDACPWCDRPGECAACKQAQVPSKNGEEE